MFGIRYEGKNLPAQQVTRFDIMRSPYNLVFSCSPFKRWVWRESPYLDMICEDWAFWIQAARNGARFQSSPSIDYEYVIHGSNITLHSNVWASENLVREKFL
jgi:hypothetical protein